MLRPLGPGTRTGPEPQARYARSGRLRPEPFGVLVLGRPQRGYVWSGPELNRRFSQVDCGPSGRPERDPRTDGPDRRSCATVDPTPSGLRTEGPRSKGSGHRPEVLCRPQRGYVWGHVTFRDPWS